MSRLSRSAQPVDELSPTRLPGRTLVTLNNVSDDLGEELSVIWEIEPGREIVPATQLPVATREGWDDPQELGAFLDAVRWGTVASADTRTLQAPFRSGITIEEYQLEPVARALAMPRVNLLVADDVGLGKTIEAGLVAQELLLRHRARRILVVCPASLTLKWRDEMTEKFGLDFTVLDAAALRDLRRSHGLQANPFTVHARTIVSLQWLRTPRVQRLLDEVLTPQTRHPGFFDLMIVDEVHHCVPPAPRKAGGYAVDSLQTGAVRRFGEHTQHRLFLSATPHNGYRESWQALLEMLDPQRFARGVEPDPATVAQVMVRRTKDTMVDEDGNPRFPGRATRAVEVAYTDEERRCHELLERYLRTRRQTAKTDRVRAGDLVALLLKKRLFSSPRAFARTLAAHAETLHTPAAIGELPDWLEEFVAGDSLLGLVGMEQLDTLHVDPVAGRRLHPEGALDFTGGWRPLLGHAADVRRTITARPVHEIRDVEHKQRLLRQAGELTRTLTAVADAITGVGLAHVSAGARQTDTAFLQLSIDIGNRVGEDEYRLRRDADTRLQAGSPPGLAPRTPLHWPLAFPEVLVDRPDPGFDAIIGNPPFSGGRKISGASGNDYLAWLQRWDGGGTKGETDLAARFVLRAQRLLNSRGQLGYSPPCWWQRSGTARPRACPTRPPMTSRSAARSPPNCCPSSSSGPPVSRTMSAMPSRCASRCSTVSTGGATDATPCPAAASATRRQPTSPGSSPPPVKARGACGRHRGACVRSRTRCCCSCTPPT